VVDFKAAIGNGRFVSCVSDARCSSYRCWLAHLEGTGMLFDIEAAQRHTNEIRDKMEQLQRDAKGILGYDDSRGAVNLGSPQQMAAICLMSWDWSRLIASGQRQALDLPCPRMFSWSLGCNTRLRT
jgi:hypothetical protein